MGNPFIYIMKPRNHSISRILYWLLLIAMTLSISAYGQNKTSNREAGNNLKIDIFSVPGVGEVSTVFIEDENGIVLVDAQRTKSDGKQVVNMVKSKNKEQSVKVNSADLIRVISSYQNPPPLPLSSSFIIIKKGAFKNATT